MERYVIARQNFKRWTLCFHKWTFHYKIMDLFWGYIVCLKLNPSPRLQAWKRKRNNERWKDVITLAEWINLNWNTRSVVVQMHGYLEKNGRILPLLVGFMAGWQTQYERIFKILYKLKYLLHLIYCYNVVIVQPAFLN